MAFISGAIAVFEWEGAKARRVGPDMIEQIDLREHRGGSARRPRYRRSNTRLASCRWLRAGDAEAERNGAVVPSAG